MKKRILTLVLTAVLFVTAVFMLSSCTMLIEKVRGGDGANLEYKLSENEKYYIVSGYKKDIGKTLKIPPKYKGKPVKTIGEGAFWACTSLTSVTIPDSVKSIGDHAFYNCENLTSVTIPDSVTSIGSHAFRNCTSLTSVTIADSVTSIGEYAFYCTGLTSVTISDSVKSIGDYAFYNCDSLTSVTILDSVTSIGKRAFEECRSLQSFVVDEDNANYKSVDGNLYTKDGKTLIQYAIGKTATSFIIPDSVTSISERAFYYCTSLTSITIPDSVTSIGESAFYLCVKLTIYCEAVSQPSSWNSGWNYSGCPVVWGYKGN